MSSNHLPSSDDLQDLLFNSLNEQGYLLQEACKYELERNNTGWSVRSAEYPVSSPEQDCKIDLVLSSNQFLDKFVLVECKRADPVYACWLFGVPKLELKCSPQCLVLCSECSSVRSDSPMHPTSQVKPLEVDVPTYEARSWLEIKANQLGRTSNPQNIENAFGQVLRGLSGFAKEQMTQKCKSRMSFVSLFIPVVVTTASLYVANYELKHIDLSTGKIGKDKVSLRSDVNSGHQTFHAASSPA